MAVAYDLHRCPSLADLRNEKAIEPAMYSDLIIGFPPLETTAEKRKEAAKGLRASLTRRAHACVGSKKSNQSVCNETPRVILFRAAARSAFQAGVGRRSKTQSCMARLGAAGPDGLGPATHFFACPRSGPSRPSRLSFFIQDPDEAMDEAFSYPALHAV